MPTLADLNRCTGCTACASACPKGCITMTADADGFCYPMVDEAACVRCGLCEKTCPVLSQQRPDHRPAAYAARSTDTQMRMESSSGGVFSELAQVILSRGGAVFGAAYDEAFRVVHICAEDARSLARLRGAKYAQSDLGSTFDHVKAHLKTGQQVLFSGTPCQVGGLKAFLGREYENLTTVDFICHGVPAPGAWRRFLEKLTAEQPLRAVNLRSKTTGWSRYRYSHEFEYANGTSSLMPSGESLYMKLFTGDCINRTSCEHCAFKGYARCSDLTLGDFWGIWDIAPEMDDDRGTSVVLVQSEKGRRLWEDIASRMVCREVTLEQASRENSSILQSSVPSPDRGEALDRIRRVGMDACEDLFPPPPAPGRRTLQSVLRRGLGFLKRRLPG